MIRLTGAAVRRTGALALTGALLTVGLTACGDDVDDTTPTDGGGEAPGTAAAAAAATWLAGELTDGILVNEEFGSADYGATIDAVYALRAVGGHDDTVAAMTDAVIAAGEDYVITDGSVWAGNAGKLTALALDAGLDPTDLDGFDALTVAEERTGEDGRTSDDSEWGDFANTFGQAWVVRGLTSAESDRAAAAAEFLLLQQCEAGYFRQDFTEPGEGEQSCDAAGGTPSIDATALAVILLDEVADAHQGLREALDDAVAFLREAQAEDGSFIGNDELPTNANSTGLAGWAFQVAGEDEAAADAAAWVHARQLPACEGMLADAVGAIAYDDDALAAAGTDGITDTTSYQWRIVTSQAVPALVAAREGSTPAECPAE